MRYYLIVLLFLFTFGLAFAGGGDNTSHPCGMCGVAHPDDSLTSEGILSPDEATEAT